MSANRAQETAKYLDFPWWLVAFDHYTVAAVSLGQMSFPDAQKHKAVVVEVAALATSEGRTSLLAVLYDERLRFPPATSRVRVLW